MPATAPGDIRADDGRLLDETLMRMERQAWGRRVVTTSPAAPPPPSDDPEAVRVRWLEAMLDGDDPGHPLGPGMPTGRPLREDGDTHRVGWMRVLRRDPCAYCGRIRTEGTVDHIEPKSVPVGGLGGAHTWLNFIGACARCNSSKSDRPLLEFLYARAHQVPVSLRENVPPALAKRVRGNPVPHRPEPVLVGCYRRGRLSGRCHVGVCEVCDAARAREAA